MTIADENGNPINTEHIPIEFENFEQRWLFHPDPNVDLLCYAYSTCFKSS